MAERARDLQRLRTVLSRLASTRLTNGDVRILEPAPASTTATT
jgi:hypothetical protein